MKTGTERTHRPRRPRFFSQNKMSDGRSNGCAEKHESRLRSKRSKIVTISAQKERNLSIKKICRVLRKDESKRTKEETDLLSNYSEIVNEAAVRLEKRERLKERLKEVEDVESVIDEKCKKLAEAVSRAEYLVVYTGAGISTSARIPDYRGASGIWTLLQKGKDIGSHDLTQAEPTYTHMALSQLYSQGKLKHVVSQNCDGLHLRSGLPRRALSEVHGNMYIEVCRSCRPIVEYIRLFDVTQYTARYSHKTMRRCYKCNNPLVDSIVHFGERGNLPWPLNWKGACKAAEKADMILCIGSSLKVLKKYPWLWSMDKPAIRRPHLYIINLQWTPKDYQAAIKINGKCDNVMQKVMKYLSISVPDYSRTLDPIFFHATELCKEEEHTTDRPKLSLVKSEFAQEDEESKGNIGKAHQNPVIDVNSSSIDPSEIKTEINGSDDQKNTDTGQDVNGLKSSKEKLILITVKSELEDCCDSFKFGHTHDKSCSNFIDEKLDIPVIMHDDLPKSERIMNLSEGFLKTETNGDGLKSTSCNVDEDSCTIENHTQAVKRTSDAGDDTKPVKKIKCDPDEAIKASSSVCERTSEKNARDQKTLKRAKTFKSEKETACVFCHDHYMSTGCLFYVKREPRFKGNDQHCECCDESEEGEENGDEEEEAAKSKGKDTAEESSDTKSKELQKAVNPGWYGKGFRKRIRKKCR